MSPRTSGAPGRALAEERPAEVVSRRDPREGGFAREGTRSLRLTLARSSLSLRRTAAPTARPAGNRGSSSPDLGQGPFSRVNRADLRSGKGWGKGGHVVKRSREFAGCTVLPMGLAIRAFRAIVFSGLPEGQLSGVRFPTTVFGTLIGTVLAAFTTLAVQNESSTHRSRAAPRSRSKASWPCPASFGRRGKWSPSSAGPCSGRASNGSRAKARGGRRLRGAQW